MSIFTKGIKSTPPPHDKSIEIDKNNESFVACLGGGGGMTLSCDVSHGHQTKVLFADIIISFNLSIDIQKSSGLKNCGHESQEEHAGALLSKKQIFPNASSVK